MLLMVSVLLSVMKIECLISMVYILLKNYVSYSNLGLLYLDCLIYSLFVQERTHNAGLVNISEKCNSY
jgi:hypothetical protein